MKCLDGPIIDPLPEETIVDTSSKESSGIAENELWDRSTMVSMFVTFLEDSCPGRIVQREQAIRKFNEQHTTFIDFGYWGYSWNAFASDSLVIDSYRTIYIGGNFYFCPVVCCISFLMVRLLTFVVIRHFSNKSMLTRHAHQ